MGKKATKASRKYASSGQLKKEIQARKKHQQVKRTIERRKGGKGKGKAKDTNDGAQPRTAGPGLHAGNDSEDGDDASDEETGK